jgi:hypothetical protein
MKTEVVKVAILGDPGVGSGPLMYEENLLLCKDITLANFSRPTLRLHP